MSEDTAVYTVIICDCCFIDIEDPCSNSLRFDGLNKDEMDFLLRLASSRGMDVVVREEGGNEE